MRFDTEGDSLKNEKRKRSSSVYLLSLSLSLKRIRALSPHEAANRPPARRRGSAPFSFPSLSLFCFPLLSLYFSLPRNVSEKVKRLRNPLSSRISARRDGVGRVARGPDGVEPPFLPVGPLVGVGAASFVFVFVKFLEGKK